MPTPRKPKFKVTGKANKAAVEALARVAWNVAGRQLAEKRKKAK